MTCTGGFCRTHHQVKQEPGGHATQPAPGHFQITTPAGRTYDMQIGEQKLRARRQVSTPSSDAGRSGNAWCWRPCWRSPRAGCWRRRVLFRVVALAARQHLRRRGRAAYSNLGAALLGQLLAARAGCSFPDLLRARVFTATIGDMARLAAAILDGTAPGCRSLTPVPDVETNRRGRRSGMFWMIDSLPSGNTMIWHNGATGGYR